MVEQIDLGFTTLEIRDDLVISRTLSGETFTRAKHEQVMAAVQPHIGDRFYLVLDEVHPYAVELNALFALRDDPAIIGVCVVAYRKSTKVVLKSAQDIINKPVQFFETLNEATQFISSSQAKNK